MGGWGGGAYLAMLGSKVGGKVWKNIENHINTLQKGANWNQQVTKSEPKGDQNASTNQCVSQDAQKVL